MSEKVLLAKPDQSPPKGYVRVTPPGKWKMRTKFDVLPDDTCPACWGSGEQRQVVPGKVDAEGEAVTRPRNCECLLRRVIRHLERLNRTPANAPGSAQAAPKAVPLANQARAAIERAEAELDTLEDQRAEAVGRAQLAVNEALAETELAQGKLDTTAEMVADIKEHVVELRSRAEEYRRQAAQLDVEADGFTATANGFNEQLLSLGARLDTCKSYQSKKSTEAARIAGRWADRMKGPKNRLERLRRRAGVDVVAEQHDEEKAAAGSTVDALETANEECAS